MSILATADDPCPICGSGRASLMIPHAAWSVVRCRGCKIARTDPEPSADVAPSYEDADYYESRTMGDAARPAWDHRALSILDSGMALPVARVLDIGAGNGGLVAALRRLDIDAEGVEISSVARDAAAKMNGVHLLADLDDLDEGARFGAITMLHVLEHIRDPLAFLRRAAQHLEPGGGIFIEVPNVASVNLLSPR